MTAADIAVVVFVTLVVVDVASVVVIARLSRRFSNIYSLRERRNVAAAIAAEVSVVCFLAINARVLHLAIEPFWTTNLLIAALTLPSIVNVIWLKRALSGARS